MKMQPMALAAAALWLAAIAAPAQTAIYFSVDIGSDYERSDPNGGGNLDPGDIYIHAGLEAKKDDALIFDNDPIPNAKEVVPVGDRYSSRIVTNFFDLDGEDQLDVVIEALDPRAVEMPPGNGLYLNPGKLLYSLDDDGPQGWYTQPLGYPHPDVPVTAPPDRGAATNEILVALGWGTWGPTPGLPVRSEVQQGLTPNPGPQETDDDIDALDTELRRYWYFSADHEASRGLDPATIYVTDTNGPPGNHHVAVTPAALGVPAGTDVDGFEFLVTDDRAILRTFDLPTNQYLAVLFSVADDDPITSADESGGLDPATIYISLLTGDPPLALSLREDDVDAIALAAADHDFGDAPAPYPTLAQDDGARHFVNTNLYLGYNVDAEANGLPHPNAIGDDTDNIQDENGVQFPYLFTPAQTSAVRIIIGSPVTSYLNAWMDFNRDGDWADAGEQIITNRPVVTSVFTNRVYVPITARAGTTFLRFRLSSTPGLSFTGAAADGEVEDYAVNIPEVIVGQDFGDAPTNYPVRLAQNGAYHAIRSGWYMGAVIDSESDGLASFFADGDDANQVPDDEDGVLFPPLTNGTTVQLQVTVSQPGYLQAWFDWNRDGDWADAGEQVLVNQPVSPWVNLVPVSVPFEVAFDQAVYARFRFSSATNVSPAGYAPDGEVEDYRVMPLENRANEDWGDAPDGYFTLADNGARHHIVPGVCLGATVDADADGIPSWDFNGDDTNGVPRDEDGVTLSAMLVPGQTALVSVVASVPGYLNAWIDFNRSTNFFQANELVCSNRVLVAGTNLVPVAVPSVASQAVVTASRWRFTTNAVANPPFGYYQPNGEVEDHGVQIGRVISGIDYGDAPAPYPTLLATNGPRHILRSGFYLGTYADPEINGFPDPSALGDDNNGLLDDEDGVVLFGALYNAATSQIGVYASAPGFVNAWIDYNRDGDWSDPGEQIASALPVVYGGNTLTVVVPDDAAVGQTFARFRFSSTNALAFDGPAPDGEVEDHVFYLNENLAACDFGDAYDYIYQTTMLYDGARHLVRPGIFLGATVDIDTNVIHNLAALGDDTNGVPDDEDGVFWPAPLLPGSNAIVQVTASTAGYLNVWVDFNRNLSWTNPGEKIFTNLSVAAGLNVLTFPVPTNATQGTTTTARFRFTTYSGLILSTGRCINGEVEDHNIAIARLQTGLDFGDAPRPYPVVNAENGAFHVLRSGFYLGAGVDNELDGQPSANADGDDLAGIPDDEDGVAVVGTLYNGATGALVVTASQAGYLNAWADFNHNGSWMDSGEQIATCLPLNPGPNLVGIPLPVGAVGSVVARFRFSSLVTLAPVGAAPDGEVEDYVLPITENTENLDFGDAPFLPAGGGYPVLLSQNGGRHWVVPGIHLGDPPDLEPDAWASADCRGDDLNGLDDENGVELTSLLRAGASNTVRVTASAPGYLNAWMDFNLDGQWTGVAERICADVLLPAGVTTVPFFLPSSTTAGLLPTRFRFSTQAGLAPGGLAVDGEVEDYRARVYPVGTLADFGDAPESYGTSLSNNAPYHLLTGPYFGLSRDAESNGLPSAAATGDDLDVTDDEDGVQTFGPMLRGSVSTATLFVAAAGNVSAWVDFNQDGDFADAGELAGQAALAGGVVPLPLLVPSNAVPGPTFARLRIATNVVTSPFGEADNGEVEDHTVTIRQAAPLQPVAFTNIVRATNSVWLFWNSEPNRSYLLEWTTNLLASPVDWTSVGPLIPGNNYQETNAAPRFPLYRLTVPYVAP